MRVLVAGVGYRDLRDHSVGVLLTDLLARGSLPGGVEVHDVSYNPVAVAQWLESLPAEERPGRLVLVTAVARGRSAGSVTAYRWDGVAPDAERVQRAVADAVTGIIDPENTLIVLGWMGALPPEVVVVEVEPEVEAFGETLSSALEPAFAALPGRVLSLATDADARALLPLAPLGGPGAPVLEG